MVPPLCSKDRNHASSRPRDTRLSVPFPDAAELPCGGAAVAAMLGAEVLARHLALDLDPFALCLIGLFPVLLKTATTNFS